jgi:DNA polymerase III delta prime subunit
VAHFSVENSCCLSASWHTFRVKTGSLFPCKIHLQEQPDAVKNPWHLAVQETNMPPRPLPVGTRITQVYDDAGGELLILGEPGAGKTTLLLELARDLLDRAEDDEIAPIPVIFTLSSWAEKQLPLAAWMIEELQSKYQVPRQLAHSWVQTDRILPLLDGLDEVHEVQLPACIEAINRYRQEHGLLPMVVCSRSDNYFAQQARILLHTAVVVQPLTREQIEAYITSAGESLKALQVALQNDPILQEIASNPLFLTILAHTYHDLPGEDVCVGAASVPRRRAVLERYVQRVLQHRKASKHYTAQQIKRWLSWLARQETKRGQTEFYIERMQPDWLADSQMRHRYQKTVVRLVYGIESLVIAALFAWLRGGKLGNSIGVGAGLLGQLGGGVGNSVLGWMAPGLGGGLEGGGSLGIIIAIITVILTLLISSPLSLLTMKAMWYGLSNGARRGLVIGGLVGLFSVVVFTLSDGLQIGLSRGAGAGLFAGLLTTLMIGLLTALRSDQVSSHMSTAPSNQKQAQSKMGTWRERLIDVGVLSLCAGIGSGMVEAALVGLNQNVFIYASIIGLFFGMALGLVGGTELIPGLGQTIMPIETTTWSWSSVRQHFVGNLSKGLIIGLSISVLMIVTIGCISGFFYGASYGLRYGLVYGLIIGVIGAVASVLAGILTSGWSGDMLDEHQLFRPNEGIRRSIRNAVFAASIFGPLGGLAGGLICGAAFGLVGGLAGWPILGLGLGIVVGLIFALRFGTIYGGIASLEHFVLRWYLWRAGSLPWNYATFLDEAAEHILLRKVGGGYMFVHRLLMEYFATLDSEGS